MRLPPPLVAISIAFMMYLANPYFFACCSLSWLPHFAIIFIISAAFFYLLLCCNFGALRPPLIRVRQKI